MRNRNRIPYERDFGGRSQVLSTRGQDGEPLWVTALAVLTIVEILVLLVLLVFYAVPIGR